MAYIFDPDQDGESRQDQRAPKRRRVTKGATKRGGKAQDDTLFVPLLNGAEKAEFVRLRQTRFEEAWGMIDQRIQVCYSDKSLVKKGRKLTLTQGHSERLQLSDLGPGIDICE